MKNNIESLRALKQEIISQHNLIGKVRTDILSMVDKLIRNHEINYTLLRYYRNGYYFGYFLLCSQLLEEQLRSIVVAVDSLILEVGEPSRLKDNKDQAIDLNRCTMGTLVDLLSKYIVCIDIVDKLKTFNRKRKLIVHHLVNDYSRPLEDFESVISEDYRVDNFREIENQLIEINKRINDEKISRFRSRYSDNVYNIIQKLGNKLSEELRQESLDVRFKF